MATSHLIYPGPRSLRTHLYLDTARLGQMSPGAGLVLQDLARLSVEEGLSLAFRTLLHHGYQAWPDDLKQAFPGLSEWAGILALKDSIRKLLCVPVASGIALAARSKELVRLACCVMVKRAKRILITDLTWPAYARVVRDEAAFVGAQVVRVSIRDVARGPGSYELLIKRLTASYAKGGCDAVFLPAVSHDGVRLPLRAIHRALSRQRIPRFFLVDGAQQIAHAPLEYLEHFCDFYVAGSHKWLSGRMPLGIAVFPRAETREAIAAAVSSHKVDDPVLSLTTRLETGNQCGYDETVNLFPLFTCQAALADLLGSSEFPVHRRFSVRLRNARRLLTALAESGCQVVQRHAALQSGIVLVRVGKGAGSPEAAEIEERLAERGIAATAYDGGLIRISMPGVPLSADDISQIASAITTMHEPTFLPDCETCFPQAGTTVEVVAC